MKKNNKNYLNIKVSITKNRMGIIYMLISSLALCIGQLLLKNVNITEISNKSNDLLTILKLIFYLAPGLFIYIVGAIFMLAAFRNGELSILQPMNSMSYVFSYIFAVFVFHEKITFLMIIGVFIIIVGVICIGGSSK